MSPFLISADLGVTELGQRARANVTALDATVAALFDDYRAARAAGRQDQVQLVLDAAYALDPQLVDELAGFDYPAAA